MSAETILWLQIAAILAVVVISFAIVTIMAWQADVVVVKSAVGWFRSWRERQRLRRDPVYLTRAATVATYEEVIQNMHVAHFESDEKPESERRSRRFIDARDATAAFLSGLEGEYLEAVVAHIHEDVMDRRVPVEDVRAWLKEECETAKYAPYLAIGHISRLVMKFREAYGLSAVEAEDKKK